MSEIIKDLSLDDIQKFGQSYTQTMNQVVYNEADAVEATLVGLLTRGNVLLTGPPGGSKTNMAKALICMFEDLTDDDLAIIPAESDLTPTRLQGGVAETSKTVSRGTDTYKEAISAEMDGIIKPHTSVIFGDEINRANPYAVNAILPALASRELVSTRGVTPLRRLVAGLFTMNPSERKQATFDLTGAAAGRMSSGAQMGISESKPEDKRKDTIRRIAQGSEPNFGSISPITSVDKINNMSERIKTITIPTNDDIEDALFEVVTRSTDLMRQIGIDEADGRFTRHVVNNARAIAAINAKFTGVDEYSIMRGAELVISARVGALSRHATEQIPEIISKLAV